MKGTSSLIVMLIACLVLPDAGAATPPVSLGNVLYQRDAFSPAQAYSRALYFERRSQDEAETTQLRLARAGLALDMGLQGLAGRILASIDEQVLDDAQLARLHFFLARNAYTNHEWLHLANELQQLKDQHAPQLESSMGMFLRAESRRVDNDLDGAKEILGQMPRTDILRRYGRFNLGVSAADTDHMAFARSQFADLAAASNPSLEHLLIAERGRLALANLDMHDELYESARRWLQPITTTTQYGPDAVARLATIAMHEHDYKRAASLLYYQVTHWPWHPVTRTAHITLPYVLEKLQPADQVYDAWTRASELLKTRQLLLTTLDDHVTSMDPMTLVTALHHPVPGKRSSIILSFRMGLGNSDWANWLSDQQSQLTMDKLERIQKNLMQLQQRQQDLAIFRTVAAEQAKRVRRAAASLAEKDINNRLDATRNRIAAAKQQLEKARQMPFDDSLAAFATPEERALLDQVSHLMERASRLQAKPEALQRIATIRGRLLYRIYDDLPVRIREHQRHAEIVTSEFEATRSRAARIRRAAKKLGGSDSMDDRITQLAGRTDRLVATSRDMLRETGQQLIAHLHRNLTTEIKDVNQQLAYAHVSMARIEDSHLAANKEQP